MSEPSNGRGKPGYCKICDSPWADAVNKLVEQGKNEAETKRAIQAIDPTMTWNRQTFYKHAEHVTHPLVTYERKARDNPPIVPKTTRGVLEAIRDIGMKRAIDNPEEVTVDHALRAATELNRTEKKVDGVFVILAKAISGQPQDVIEGEFYEELPETEEVPQLGNSDA